MQAFIPTRFVTTAPNSEIVDALDQAVAQPGSKAQLFIYGEPDTGKTVLANEHVRKNSERVGERSIIVHPGMLTLMLTTLFEQSEEALGDIGEAGTLLIDNLDDALNEQNSETAAPAILHLVKARNAAGLNTVVFAQHPLSHYADAEFYPAISDMREMCLEPLDREGRIELFRQIMTRETAGDKEARTYTDDALEFFADTSEDNLAYAVKAAEVILHSSDFPRGEAISAAQLEEYLVDDGE